MLDYFLKKYNTIIIGGGAAGLMCAWQAAKRGLDVAIIEHTGNLGEKIRISGGGRCNFTNLYSAPDNYISSNPHFCKSALKRFDQHDFIEMVKDHEIKYHEKSYDKKLGNENAPLPSKGQLFCDDTSADILDMLQHGFANEEGTIHLKTKVNNVKKNEDDSYFIRSDKGDFECKNLVIASGGLSIPKIGASNFGYELAKQFGLNIIPPRAALVPLTFDDDLLSKTFELSGISVDASVSCNGTAFREGLLFTHRGLSGPSILQISSYWQDAGELMPIVINLMPNKDILELLKRARKDQPKQLLRSVLSEILPSRLAQFIAKESGHDERIADLSDKKLMEVVKQVNAWEVIPKGSEGYRTAEVTLGGIDTKDVSSKTFEAKNVSGLYFIGEVLDVTGHLGGHNFQWAWSSGWCCAQSL